MLTFDFDKSKCLRFLISEAVNLNQTELKIAARLKINEVEYCFPGRLINDSVQIEIPALSSVLKENDQSNKQYDIVVEAITKDSYLTPFEDTFIIESHTKLQMEMVGEEEKKEEKINLTISEETDVEEKKEEIIVEEKKVPAKTKKSVSEKFLEI